MSALRIVALWGLLANPEAVPDRFAPYRGQPVLAVDVEAPEGDDPVALQELIDIQPGYLLAQGDVEEALKRLYTLGRFAQVEAYAERLSGVVILHFRLVPIKRLGEILIAGAPDIDQPKLRRALRIGGGDEVDSQTPQHLSTRAKAFLERAGYPAAEVSVVPMPSAERRTGSYVLQIKQNAPLRIEKIRFAGAPRLPADLLQSLIAARVGAVLDRDMLDSDRASLRQAYIDHGFLAVSVSAPLVEMAPGGVEVVWQIDAGRRVDVEFSGNTLFSDETLRSLWPDSAGAMGLTTLRTLRARILTHYQRAGYEHCEVTLRGFAQKDRGIERYLFTIREGVPVEVGEVQFEGVHAFEVTLLRQQVEAVLRRELADTSIFGRLWRDETPGITRPATAPPLGVAPERRWVPDLYSQAADDIAAAYHDLGYTSADVTHPDFVPYPNGSVCAPVEKNSKARQRCVARVRFVVTEGPQTFIKSVGFAGNSALSGAELLDTIYAATGERELSGPLTPGGPLSSSGIEDGRIEITRRYRDLGYLYVHVFSNVRLDPHAPWADVSYTIEEGPQVRIQRVLVRGNRYTREGIIRSRLTFAPGDLYRLEQAVADQRSIASLGVFSNVRVKLIDEERPAERKDLVADVVERSRQPVEIVPGVSTAMGPRLRLSYSHLNVGGTASAFIASLKLNRQIFFDLFGEYGPLLRERYAAYAGTEQLTKALEREVRLGIRSPRLKALPFDPLFRIDLVDQRINALRYALDSTALIFGIDMLMARRLKGSIETQLGVTNLECIKEIDPNCDQNAELRHGQSQPIDVGERWTFKYGPLLVFDHRDSPLNPTSGYFASIRISDAFGSSRPTSSVPYTPFAFIKYDATLTGYVSLAGATLAVSARGGTIHQYQNQVPIDERFYLGGRDTLRGFIESTLIPEDACVTLPNAPRPPRCNEAVNPIINTDGSLGPALSRGGNTYALLKTELRLPIRANFSFDVFVDLGNLWIDFPTRQDFTLRVGTGVGLRYATPVGALAIDFGINPAPRVVNAEAANQVHLSIGSF